MLVPEDHQPELVCHLIVKWPLQGRLPAISTWETPQEAVAALVAAGYAGDAISVLTQLL